jgi:hypothetical protein
VTIAGGGRVGPLAFSFFRRVYELREHPAVGGGPKAGIPGSRAWCASSRFADARRGAARDPSRFYEVLEAEDRTEPMCDPEMVISTMSKSRTDESMKF